MSRVIWEKTLKNVTVKILDQYPEMYYVQVIHENTKTCHVDYPCLYDNGVVAYDFPERVPKYSRKIVREALNLREKLLKEMKK